MFKCICKNCSKEFYLSRDRTKDGRGKYCSKECRLLALHNSIKGKNNPNWVKKVKKVCKFCKNIFHVTKERVDDNRGKFCSLQCKYSFGHTIKSRKKMSKSNMGRLAWNKGKKCYQFSKERSHWWKGGKQIDKDGYVLIHNPNHPSARGNYILEHRMIMEEHLGRPLKPKEVVHHIDEVRTNNHIDNLRLFPSNKEHLEYHRLITFT